MPSRHLEVPGGVLFVVDEGAGPPIILLHARVALAAAIVEFVAPLDRWS